MFIVIGQPTHCFFSGAAGGAELGGRLETAPLKKLLRLVFGVYKHFIPSGMTDSLGLR